MRARQVKPGFFKNEILAACTPHARLLFEGLWMLGDRGGRLEDRPLRIKAELFPYEDVDAEALLAELASKRNGNKQPEFLIRYSRPEGKFIQIVNFERHQNPHVNEKPSTLPAPEPSDTSTVQVQKRHSTTRASSLTPSSLTPSSLTPDSPLPESGASTDLFEAFYNPYLRHDARLDAEKAWARLSMQDRLECLEKTPTWVKAKAGTEKKFIPLPATFLNKKRWRDPLEDLTEKVGGSPLQAAPSPAQKCWRCENTMNREDLMGSTKFCRECRKKGAI